MKHADLTPRGRSALRSVALGVLGTGILFLLGQIAWTLWGQDTLPDGDQRLGGVVELHATDPIVVRVEVDDTLVFRKQICTREVSCDQRFGPAKKISLELADLERATVRYNGRRVKPLGTLDEPRRLVFIDDSI